MMILDTTAINYILKENILLDGNYFITPDIEDEILAAEIVWNRKVPSNIKNIISTAQVNEALYIKNYFYVLNKHGGRSFFNMTGFGDISLISLVKTLVESDVNILPFSEYKPKICLYTGDEGLKKRIIAEVGDEVELRLPEEI